MKTYIVLCGTSSVGKTTLVKPLTTLLENKYEESVVSIAEVARSVEKRGLKINKEATCTTQRLIEDEYIRLENKLTNNVKVADRSIIDRFAYSLKNEGSSGKEKQELLDWYDSNIVEHCKKYSYIFHIPLTEDLKLELDGVRSPDETYRRDIDSLQKWIIDKYSLKVHTIKGTTEERLVQINKVIGDTYGFVV